MKKHPVRPGVLHVVERPTEASSDLDRGIARAGFGVQRVETVYGAMARLVRPDNLAIKAVVVCIDALEASELAFFTIAAERWPGIPLYVYGRAQNGHRRQRALALGVASEIAANRITTLLADLSERPLHELEPQLRPAIAELTVQVEPPPPEPAVAEAEDGSRIQVEEKTIQQEPTPPGRVAESPRDVPTEGQGIPTPWQPASSRPKRTPPGARKRAGESGESTKQRAEALLSQQEIDALLDEPESPDEAEDAARNGSA